MASELRTLAGATRGRTGHAGQAVVGARRGPVRGHDLLDRPGTQTPRRPEWLAVGDDDDDDDGYDDDSFFDDDEEEDDSGDPFFDDDEDDDLDSDDDDDDEDEDL